MLIGYGILCETVKSAETTPATLTHHSGDNNIALRCRYDALAIFTFVPRSTTGGLEMDYVKAFVFFREDNNWISKLLIGGLMGLLGFLIIPTFILYGYGLTITRNIIHGEKNLMPEWDDWGQLLTDGVLLWLIQMIWALPFVIVGLFTVVPAIIGMVIVGESGDMGVLFGSLGIMLTCGLLLVLGVLAALVIPPATILFAREGNFGAAFNIREIIEIMREQWVQIIVSMLILFAAGLAFAVVFAVTSWTIIVPIFLGFIGPVWFQFAQSHLYGQIGFLQEGSAFAGKFDA
jgi:hypothetical protein